MWSPRSAFPAVARQPALPWLIVLAAASGVTDDLAKLLRKAVTPERMQPLADVFTAYLVFGSTVGLLTLWALPWPLSWAVNKFGTRTSPVELRRVLGWSLLPRLPLLVFLCALVAARPQDFVVWGSKEWQANAHFLFGVFLALQATTGLWSAFICVLGIAAIGEVTTGRALGAFLLGSIAWMVLCTLVFATLLWYFRDDLSAATEFFGKW